MNEFLKSWKTYVIGMIVAVSCMGLGVAADNRWLTRTHFDSYVQAVEQRDILEEIRFLEREINEKTTQITYTQNEGRAAALEQQILFLEEQLHALERELEHGISE